MSDIKFRKREVFPNPSKTFFFKLEPIESIKNDCIFIIDANVLLLPFTTGVKSLDAIKNVYKTLSDEDRVFLPAQAVREFLDNRAQKISDMNEALSKKMNQSYQYVGSHPLLSELEEYKSLEEEENKLREAIKSYNLEIKKTLNVIQSWGWNDPVSDMYHEVLLDRVLNDDDLDLKEIEKDLERRNTLNIPPGYKDKGKEENSAGDLLIWHEILKVGSSKKKHLIFVSGDEKADWWHQSGKKPLYPRFELVDEYGRESDGKSFHIISLSTLLKSFGVEDDVIEAVRSSEKNVQQRTKQSHLSNAELYEKSMNIVKDLRSSLLEERMRSDHISNQRMNAMSSATEEERNALWNKFNELDRDPTRNLMSYYDINHKVDAILLREEIVKRLPEDVLENRESSSYLRYERPTNPLGLAVVVDDLEYIAKCLP